MEEKIKRERINSIDILKGFSIFWIVGGHTTLYWLTYSCIWEQEMLYIFFLSTVGPANFLMLSGLNLSISFNQKMENGWSKREFHIYYLKRIAVLLLLSCGYNLFMNFIIKGINNFNIFDLYSWYILQVIGFSLIISMYMLKIRKIYRIILAIILIFIADPIYYFLISLNYPGKIVAHILYYPFPEIFWAFPFLPWGACGIIGSVIGDYFYKAMYKGNQNVISINDNNRIKFKNENLKNFIFYLTIIGILFVAISVVFGSVGPTSTDSMWYKIAVAHITNLNTAPFFNFSTLSYMFLPGHWTYMFYALGADFLMLSFLAFLSDYKQYKNKIFDFFSFAGKVAFSVFIYHHLGIPLFYRTFDWIWVWPAWVGYAIFIIALLWLDVKKLKGIGTIEWIMIMATSWKDIKRKEVEKKIK